MALEGTAPVAMSLRWCIHGRPAPAAAEMVRTAGFAQVELCGLDRRGCRWWLAERDRLGLEAVSVHAPCPDEARQGSRFPGDWLLHDDPQLRAAALRFGRATIRFAQHAGVPYAVFHLGSYGLRAEYEALVTAVVSGNHSEARRCREAYVAAVHAESYRRRDRLMTAVDRLLSEAGGDVTVCVENRYRLDQAPNLADVVHLKAEFDGLAYWHDTGHEATQRHLGVWDEDAYEGACEGLAGVHLHDCVGTDDHRPPGEGTYDFLPVLRRWLPGMPLVLEIAPGVSQKRVQMSTSYIHRALYAARQMGGDR